MNTESELFFLKRRHVAKQLLADRKNLIVVGGLGSCAWDITEAGDHDLNFPLWGAMGGAASVGLGLALSKPNHRVLVITGDGEMLMGMGSLATIAQQEPKHLAVVIFDNERYGETGMQKTHPAFGVCLLYKPEATDDLLSLDFRGQPILQHKNRKKPNEERGV